MRRIQAFAVICACLLAGAGTGSADDLAAAREHYDRGTTLYDLQRFSEAAKEYEAAYEAKHDPALLFNIGQAYRFAGEYAKAVGAFRAFLRNVPRTQKRDEVLARISEMQRQLDEQRQNKDKPPAGTIAPAEVKPSAPEAAPTTPPPVEKPMPEPPPPLVSTPPPPERPDFAPGRTKRIAGIAVGAAGVALLGLGAAFAVLAKSAFDEIDAPAPGYVFKPATQDALKTDQALEISFFAIGGAALVAGVTTFVLGWREGHRPPVALVPIAGSHQVGATLELTF